MVDETALISRSSDQILFFKRVYDKVTKTTQWENYHTLDKMGNIFFIPGNIRFQVTTSTHIYFYLIDFESYLPTLENVMFNFMNCN